MDLVSCRNMLIYLRPDAQQRVLRRLAYGLKAGGCLFLGSSEMPGELAGDHTTLDNRHRIYRLNRRIQRLSSDDLLSGGDGRRRRALFSDASGEGGKGAHGLQGAVDALMEAYVPPSVLIDADRSVLHMFGDIQRYLRFKGNSPTLDILQLLPKTAAPIVATLLHSAARDKSLQRSRPLPIDWGNGALEETFHVTVRPLDTDSVRVSRLIVSFEPVQREAVHEARILDDEAIVRMSSKHVADLERELEITRANLQDSIQELGTANEELQASNE
jgi:two-component system CheB/CheR fusion protein